MPTVRKVKRGGRKKGHKKSLLRLKMLQKYCNKLLSCDIQVLRSADLVQFFQPTDQDLLPDFSKNRYWTVGRFVSHGGFN